MKPLASRGPLRMVAAAVAALVVPLAVVSFVSEGPSGAGRGTGTQAAAPAQEDPAAPAAAGAFHRGPRCWSRPEARWCRPSAAAATTTTAPPGQAPATAGRAPAPSYRAGAYPNPASTGVPAGWEPAATHQGDLWVYDAGTVIEDMLITGDLQIRATNVTVRRTRVMGIIWNQWDDDEQFGGLLIEDVEVGPDEGVLNWGHGSVGTAGFTARRVEIHNVTDGFRVSGDDIVIEDSFVKLSVREGECNHLDGVQGYGGGRNVVVRHNTIDARGNCGNAAVFFGDSSPEADVQDNIIMGGAFSLRLHQVEVPTVFVAKNNHVVNGAYDYGALYFVDAGALNLTCEGNDLVTIDSNYQITGTVGPAECSIDNRQGQQ
jgi:hypothetical protein